MESWSDGVTESWSDGVMEFWSFGVMAGACLASRPRPRRRPSSSFGI
jgi:hypothetical protein